MLKKSIVGAAAISAALIAFQPANADAGWRVHAHIAAPWSGPYHVHVVRPFRRAYRKSCARIRASLHARGYRRVRALDCRGKFYKFKAKKRGFRYVVVVNAFNGRVVARY